MLFLKLHVECRYGLMLACLNLAAFVLCVATWKYYLHNNIEIVLNQLCDTPACLFVNVNKNLIPHSGKLHAQSTHQALNHSCSSTCYFNWINTVTLIVLPAFVLLPAKEEVNLQKQIWGIPLDQHPQEQYQQQPSLQEEAPQDQGAPFSCVLQSPSRQAHQHQLHFEMREVAVRKFPTESKIATFRTYPNFAMFGSLLWAHIALCCNSGLHSAHSKVTEFKCEAHTPPTH